MEFACFFLYVHICGFYGVYFVYVDRGGVCICEYVGFLYMWMSELSI